MQSLAERAARAAGTTGLESQTLMRMLLADLALLERVEEHCRKALRAADDREDVAQRIASVAEIARRLAKSKEQVASELLLQGRAGTAQ